MDEKTVYKAQQALLDLSKRDCPDCCGTGKNRDFATNIPTCLGCSGTGRILNNHRWLRHNGYHIYTTTRGGHVIVEPGGSIAWPSPEPIGDTRTWTINKEEW
jgi:DnaJ-class molecular chaperone